MRLLLYLWVMVIAAHGQPKKISELNPGPIENISVDRLGNFYLILKNSVIQKYNPDGELLAESKPMEAKKINVEAWNPLQIVVHSPDSFHYHILDHELQNERIVVLDSSLAIFPHLISPGYESSLWIIDGADQSLKRIESLQKGLTYESKLQAPGWDDDPNIIQIREYQNMIFLLDTESGISMFTSLGKLVRSIEERNIKYFNFMGEELYFLKDNKIILFDLYTEETRELKIEGDCIFALITDERLILVKKDTVEIFEYFLQ